MSNHSSRRQFLALGGAGAAWSSLFETGFALPNGIVAPAVQALLAPSGNVEAVKIDANENPYGPSEKAIQAIQKSFSQSGR
ncbi:MAG: histidinol-phosphate aminotransferase family protein, partial [Acidobacteria bacterium]|nr:histidinol-phosphate aminotransferase family protein [Acidobacteriota bacterium]